MCVCEIVFWTGCGLIGGWLGISFIVIPIVGYLDQRMYDRLRHSNKRGK